MGLYVVNLLIGCLSLAFVPVRTPLHSPGTRALNHMQPSGVITITTDFGHKGPFAAVMKGVILGHFPDCEDH